MLLTEHDTSPRSDVAMHEQNSLKMAKNSSKNTVFGHFSDFVKYIGYFRPKIRVSREKIHNFDYRKSIFILSKWPSNSDNEPEIATEGPSRLQGILMSKNFYFLFFGRIFV